MLANVAVSAAGGTTLASVVGSIALTNSVAHGDRKMETEADNLAWEYMLRTNYNIGACAAVQQRFVEIFGAKNKSTILNPSDHPDSDKRRDNYAKKLFEYSGKHAEAKDGVVKLARMAGVPIVPVCWYSTNFTWVKFPSWDGLRMPIFNTNLVNLYGDAIYVNEDSDDEEIRQRLQKSLEILDEKIPEAYNEVYQFGLWKKKRSESSQYRWNP